VNLEQAIRTALQFETRVRDTYREAAAASRDATGRRVFAQLAGEEQGHLDYLEHRLEEWLATGSVQLEPLATSLPSSERIQTGVQAMRARVAGRPTGVADQGEVALLQRALEAEIQTRDFYRGLLSELDPADLALFERFAEIEDGHVAIVAAELDNVKGLGFWFDTQEFDLQGE
jgi:rubrerythrin